MRLILMLIVVGACAYAGYKYYPELYQLVTGKEAPVEKIEKGEVVPQAELVTPAP